MGKFSNALSKYAKERQGDLLPETVTPVALRNADIEAIIEYDRETGHLLKYDRKTGHVDDHSIEALRQQGTIERLLSNELIYPGGKLTPKGLQEANRLAAQHRISADTSKPPAGQDRPEDDDIKVVVEKALGRQAGQEALAKPLAPARAEKAPDFRAQDFVSAYANEERPAAGTREDRISGRSSAGELPTGIAQAQTAKARAKDEQPFAAKYDEGAIDRGLVALLDPHSYEAEQFKILRTNILFPVSGNPPRSILLTSTAPGEGKTFSAANLAISIALNINKHVLLIDADLRRPQLHQRFGFGEVPGLSNYLADGRPLPSLLLKTRVDKLTLLPGGLSPENPAELVGSERMAGLIAEVSSRYADRLIVIDAPPPGMAAETGVLARQVDGILLVIRFGKTRQTDLADLMSRVGEKKILGSIINHMETSTSRYYGYKYGGYRKKKPNAK